jgi:hypothetical protein
MFGLGLAEFTLIGSVLGIGLFYSYALQKVHYMTLDTKFKTFWYFVVFFIPIIGFVFYKVFIASQRRR